jgi:protein-L-isoaspartate(D-aspartate) O-methyltransferase
MEKYDALIEQLVARRVLTTPDIARAFRKARREHFLPADVVEWAGEDHPLPIGHGQTNSQPYTVAFMFELLQPEADQTVLDVGCGSGWTTAMLAEIVGSGGRVIGTERILVSAAAQEVPPQLVDQLAVDAILVIPVRHSIFKITKTSQGTRSEEHTGFSFVPLVD